MNIRSDDSAGMLEGGGADSTSTQLRDVDQWYVVQPSRCRYFLIVMNRLCTDARSSSDEPQKYV